MVSSITFNIYIYEAQTKREDRSIEEKKNMFKRFRRMNVHTHTNTDTNTTEFHEYTHDVLCARNAPSVHQRKKAKQKQNK